MDDLKEKIIQKIKAVVKKVVKIAMAKLMPIFLICFLVLVLITGITYIITIDDGTYKEDDWSNTPFAVSELALSEFASQKIVKKDDGYGFDIDLDTKVDEIIKKLEEKDGVLDQYISTKNQKEYLKAFIRAEIITQYPDLRNADKIGTPVEDGEVQGCIQIHRALSDSTNGETQLLTYVDYEIFSSYVANGDSKATQHFTLDENENLVVAGWTRVTTNVKSNIPGVENISDRVEYTLTTNSINYKPLLQRYSMPFDFLWALTVMGDDEEFSYKVAQLALNSKIIITVQDNLNTVITEDMEEYNIQTKTEKSAKITANVNGSSYSKDIEKQKEEDPVQYKTESIIKTENCRTNLQITYADTWIAKYENVYTNVIPSDSVNENTSTEPNTEYVLKEQGNLKSDSEISTELHNFEVEKCGGEKKYKELLSKNRVSGTIGVISYKKYERIIDRKKNAKITTSSNMYTSGTQSVTEKTDKNSTEDNFVTLFVKSDKAKPNILSATEWLFEMLEEGPKTANMVDIVKYLLYKATGEDYGVTTFDTSIFDLSKFENISGGVSSLSLLKEYIHTWEHSTPPPTNADGTKYIIETDGNGHPTVGYGVDIENSGYKQVFINAGYPTNVGGEVDKEFVDSIEDEIISNSIEQVKSKTSGLNLTGYQINALVSRAYNCGVGGAIDTQRGSPSLNFLSSYQNYWKQERDDKFEDKDNNADFNHSLYTQYMSKPVTSDGTYMAGLERRRKSEWTLFQTGYYDVLDKWHTSASAESFLAAADEVHREEMDWVYYTQGGNLYWNNIDASINNSTKATCCATYVSCVIYRAGYASAEQLNSINYNLCSDVYDYFSGKGWKVVNSYDDLEGGDIVFMNYYDGGSAYDHVQIYAGDDTWYNAGSTDAIQRASPYSQGTWARSNFFVALRPEPII